MSDEVYQAITLLYVGRLLSDNKKLCYCYLLIEKDSNTGQSLEYETSKLWLYSKSLHPGLAGTIFTIKSDGKGKVLSHSSEYADQWKNPNQVHEWQLASRAAAAKSQDLMSAKKAYTRDFILEQLAPIKKAMIEMSTAQRRAVVAFILEYLL